MRFDFFRRPASRGGIDGPETAVRTTDEHADRDADDASNGYVSYALQLDGRMRVKGYRFGWRAVASGSDAPNASAQFKELLSCVSKHLVSANDGWRLGQLAAYLDVTVDALFLNELQSLPSENVVLCMGIDDMADADTRSMLLFLREQGFGFMLRDAQSLPQEPELLEIITHLDVGTGEPDLIARIRRDEQPGRPPLQLLATRMKGWGDFDALAARRVDVLVDEMQARPPVEPSGNALQPESVLIVRLMQMLQRNENLRSIESALKRDAALTYRLLHHINSPAIGAGVEITSLRHAVAMLGYSPLFRWLSLLLATSNKASSPFMMKKAILRGRFVELMGQGMLPPSESDNLFVVGMLSLIDQLLGIPMQEVLAKIQLADSVQQAILSREGVYAPFLALVEACERDGGESARRAEALFVSAGQVNAAHLAAMVWAHEASALEGAD